MSVHVNCKLHQQYWSLDLNLAELAAKHKNASWPQGRQPIPPASDEGREVDNGTIYKLFSLLNRNSKFLPNPNPRGSHKLKTGPQQYSLLGKKRLSNGVWASQNARGITPPSGLQSFGNRDEGKG